MNSITILTIIIKLYIITSFFFLFFFFYLYKYLNQLMQISINFTETIHLTRPCNIWISLKFMDRSICIDKLSDKKSWNIP